MGDWDLPRLLKSPSEAAAAAALSDRPTSESFSFFPSNESMGGGEGKKKGKKKGTSVLDGGKSRFKLSFFSQAPRLALPCASREK